MAEGISYRHREGLRTTIWSKGGRLGCNVGGGGGRFAVGVVVGVGSCWICNGGGGDRFAMGVGVTDLQWGW